MHEDGQRFGIQLCTTKEMHMVRHDDIAPDRPAVAIMRTAPFVAQESCNLTCSQDGSSSERAGGDEINWLVDPDAFKPTQMLVHLVICSPRR